MNDEIDDSRARRLYPDAEDRWGFSVSDYDPILHSFGEVVVKVDENDYSGDSLVLLRKESRYGFLIFGWGSCSGCDALQGCNSYRDIEQLIQQLENNIIWFDSLGEAESYIFNAALRQGSYYYQTELWGRFQSKVRSYLLAQAPAWSNPQ